MPYFTLPFSVRKMRLRKFKKFLEITRATHRQVVFHPCVPTPQSGGWGVSLGRVNYTNWSLPTFHKPDTAPDGRPL